MLKDRRLAAGAVLAVALLLLAGFGLAGGQGPTRIIRICGNPSCGHTVVWTAGPRAPTCPACGGTELLKALWCEACDAPFPLRLEDAGRGNTRLAPCPRCGSLAHTDIPEALRN